MRENTSFHSRWRPWSFFVWWL